MRDIMLNIIAVLVLWAFLTMGFLAYAHAHVPRDLDLNCAISPIDARVLMELVKGQDQYQALQYLEDLELTPACQREVAWAYGVTLN